MVLTSATNYREFSRTNSCNYHCCSGEPLSIARDLKGVTSDDDVDDDHCYCRYLEVLLMRVACNAGQIVYSPSRKAFVSVSQGEGPFIAAEEYADLTGRSKNR